MDHREHDHLDPNHRLHQNLIGGLGNAGIMAGYAWDIVMGMTNRLRASGALLALGVIPHLLTGCSGTSIVEPGFNPKTAAAQAMDLYDTNRDGAIDTAELVNAASLRAVLPKADTDGDGRLTQAELATRFGTYRAGELLVTTFPCSITLDGQPLVGEDVQLIPEPFMGDAYEVASATTSTGGQAVLSAPSVTARGFSGVFCGVYRVEISSKNGAGEETIPANYNSASELGQEIAPDREDVERGVVLALERPKARKKPGRKNE